MTFLRYGSLFTIAIAGVWLAGCDSGPGPGPVDADAPKEFTTTPSGLKYRILRKSEGKKPTSSSKVKAHYKGWLDDGNVFDSSYSKGKGAVELPLNMVIAGWTEDLQLIGEGGMIELEVPPDLGYRQQKMGPIPPNSTLHFIVELESVP
jgi:FKBP-type peptidyl-prolyl cis-trans isomerase